MAGVDIWTFVIGLNAATMTETPNMPYTIGLMTRAQCEEFADKLATKGSDVLQHGVCRHIIGKRDCPLSDEDLKKYTACPVWELEPLKK